MTQHFDYYLEAWIIYIVLGVVFIYLLDLKLRKTYFALRAGLLSLIAVLAFTPQKVFETESLAPMILTSLFNAEIEGIESITQGGLTLFIIWGIVFALTLAIRHLIMAKIQSNNEQ